MPRGPPSALDDHDGGATGGHERRDLDGGGRGSARDRRAAQQLPHAADEEEALAGAVHGPLSERRSAVTAANSGSRMAPL